MLQYITPPKHYSSYYGPLWSYYISSERYEVFGRCDSGYREFLKISGLWRGCVFLMQLDNHVETLRPLNGSRPSDSTGSGNLCRLVAVVHQYTIEQLLNPSSL